jgi:hypothetical protein
MEVARMNNARAILFYSVIAIFVATAILTLLGISGVVAIEDRFLQVLFTALVVELVAAVVGLFKATDWFGGERGSKRIEGGWWQLVRAAEHVNALAFFQIAYSEEREQLVIDGQSFTADGEDHARFWSVSASLDASTLELYYLWKGDHEGSDEDFSGLGYIRFTEETKSGPLGQGDGWYTTGNLDSRMVTAKRKAEFRRASASDVTTMLSRADRAARRQLAASVFAAARQDTQPV